MFIFKGTRGLIIMLIAVGIFIFIVGLVTQTNEGKQTILSPYFHLTASPSPTSSANTKTLKINTTSINVMLADTESLREKGLSGIQNLPFDQGMLFVFDSHQVTPSFWMKGMLIPLDFIWIGNNKVVEITPNVPAPSPNTPDNKLPVYAPDQPIDFVLEVNAGFNSQNNIKVGDSVTNL